MPKKTKKGYTNFRGIIGGIERAKSAIEKGDKSVNYYESDKVKKITFSIKTSEGNIHYIRVMAFKNTSSAWLSRYNKETKKNETKEIKFEERSRTYDDWSLIGVKMKSQNDENVVSLVTLDAIDYLISNFNDGDGVFISGKKENSEYNDKKRCEYELDKIFAAKGVIDFGEEDFEEQSDFSEEFIFEEAIDAGDMTFVKGYTIDYKEDITAVEYLVEKEDADVGEYFKNSLNFGDLVKVEGIINNRVVYKYREAEESEDSDAPLVGRKTKTSKQRSNQQIREIESENRSIQIIAIEEVVSEAYSKAELDMEDVDLDSDLPF